MDARQRLRAYLEQRRELGESEFTLDGMSVDDALATIDKLRRSNPPLAQQAAPRSKEGAHAPPKRHRAVEENAGSVRESSPPLTPVETPRDADPVPDVKLQAAPAENVQPERAEDVAMKNAPQGLLQGLVVGNSNGTLFQQNPFHSVRSLDALAKLIEDCTRCSLYRTAKHAVPGTGNPDADFMCVGEAPGANEDETGQPFVGQAGGLLTKILAAIDLTRDEVFITNVLKHRPPGNRNPQPDEVDACGPYLVRQIQMVKPKVILALGTFAAQTLLNTKTPIGKLRGAVHRYYGIPLVVTYHPAALLRNPAWKRPTWEDVKLARHVLDNSKS